VNGSKTGYAAQLPLAAFYAIQEKTLNLERDLSPAGAFNSVDGKKRDNCHAGRVTISTGT
jgi:hypothetical protein